MKVVIAISHSFCANFIKGQSSFLKRKGLEVIIISASGEEVENVAQTEGTRLVVIPFSREISLFKDLKDLISVFKFLKKEKPQIINAGNPKTGFLFAIACCFFPNIRMIFTLRGLRSDTLTGFKKMVVYCTEWLSCSLAQQVIVISPSLKDHAVAVGVLNPKKAVVIGKGSSNGININEFKHSEENLLAGKTLREGLGIQQGDLVIGYVGRITRDKGVEELYQAFRICRGLHKNLKLVIVGPFETGDEISTETLNAMKEDLDVVFLGKRNKLAGIYTAFDMLVLYSYREGFGNVALEAAAMGKPVIVSDIPGARDTTEHMKSGLHVQPRNIPALAKAIKFYIDNPEFRKQHGQYGQKRAMNSFSSEVIWNGQYELYKSLNALSK